MTQRDPIDGEQRAVPDFDEALSRRISAALDRKPGATLDVLRRLDDELADAFADTDAAAFAEELAAVDRALASLGAQRTSSAGAERDWDAMAAAIEARLDRDEELDDIGDPAAPPRFEGELEAQQVAAAIAGAAAPVGTGAAAAVAAMPVTSTALPDAPTAPVVELAARRRRIFAAIGGLAAAAAVGLGVTAGFSMNSRSPEYDSVGASGAAAPVSVEAAEVAMDPAAEPAPPMPAAAPAAGERNEGYWAQPETSEAATSADVAGAWEPEEEAPMAVAPTPTGMMGPAPMDSVATPREVPLPEPARAAADRAPTARRARAASGASGTSLGLARGVGGGGGGGGAAPRTDALLAGPAHTVDALRRAEPAVRACLEEGHVAGVRVTVDGSTGDVTGSSVVGALGAAERACVEGVVRGLHMPTSASGTYVASYTYRPQPVAGGSLAGRSSASRSRSPASPAATPANETAPPPADTR